MSGNGGDGGSGEALNSSRSDGSHGSSSGGKGRNELVWHKPPISGEDVPTKRSGHSFTILGNNGFLFGGCDSMDPAGPSNSLYQLKMSGNFEWVRLDGDVTYETPGSKPPVARWMHSTVVHEKKFLIVFGGFHSSEERLNDIAVFDTITLTWTIPQGESLYTPRGNFVPVKADLAPSPRGGHSASVIDGKMWVFGGYGGQGFSRKDFSDVHALDLETMEWVRVPAIKGIAPKPRSNHTASIVDHKIYVFGGWNAVEQFSDLCILDTSLLTWTMVETFVDPRWGHTAASVEAIPYWKVFCFGGATGDLAQHKRAQGTYSNTVMVLDSGSDTFDRPRISGEIPCPRSDATFAYDSKGSRLVLFGGWANQWLDDVYTLDVGCVVGPPYAIMGIYPDNGPITGETELTIKGIDFVKDDKDPRIKVRFVSKRGEVVDVAAKYVNKETITCASPCFDELVDDSEGEVMVDVRVAFRDDSFTTTSQSFSFLTVANAGSCLAFGPGLLNGGCPGLTTSFVIHSNDSNGDLRSTGGDEFEVVVRYEEEGTKVNGVTIEDNEDGTYLVEYEAPEAGAYSIEVTYMGVFKDENGQRYDTGKSGPIRGSPMVVEFDDTATKSANQMAGPLLRGYIEKKYQSLRKFVSAARVQLEKAITPSYAKELASDVNCLLSVKEKLFQMETEGDIVELDMDIAGRVANHLQEHHGKKAEKKLRDLEKLRSDWNSILGMMAMANTAIKPHVVTHGTHTKDRILDFELKIKEYEASFKEGSKLPFYDWDTGPEGAINAIAEAADEHDRTTSETQEIRKLADLFEFPELCENINTSMAYVDRQLKQMQLLWEVSDDALIFFDESKATLWRHVQPEVLEDEARNKAKALKALHKEVRWCSAFKGLEREVKNFLITCPLIAQLGSKAMRDRHWAALKKLVNSDFTSPNMDDSLRLSEVLDLNLHEYSTEVEDIAERASNEAKMETALDKLERTWSLVRFVEEPVPGYESNADEVKLLRISEDDLENLEGDQIAVKAMASSRFSGFFTEPYTNSAGARCKGVKYWNKSLAAMADTTALLEESQRTWCYLVPLFVESEEVKQALPEDAERFKNIDEDVRRVLVESSNTRSVLKACTRPNLLETLEELNEQLEVCQKSLVEFLGTKRMLFPRFYFVSETDLLDIVSNGSSPEKVLRHIPKVFLATKTLHLDDAGIATRWESAVGQETGTFTPPVPLTGKVEAYLQSVLDGCRGSLQDSFKASLARYASQQRSDWLLHRSKDKSADYPVDLAQIALLVAGISYVSEVESVFKAYKQGNRTALLDYNARQKQQLDDLVRLVLKGLGKGDHQRVVNLITRDAHARDTIDHLIRDGATDASDFLWQSQLKQRVESDGRPMLEICDARFEYGHEYIGNGARLVITPLTDRIYVTAAQALNYQMGCASLGPAGTGKTETTKEFAAALGRCCYIFNCAPETDYCTTGNFFLGLAATGAWGCLDEFDRLDSQILSVCIGQLKAVCEGVRAQTPTVTIGEAEIKLDDSCGVFATMNPGYSGRNELPEGLKTLFRPVTVMIPDLFLVCQNVLLSEGFIGAKDLASKFCRLYTLSSELLSTQAQYDWGLRAMKSILNVAGSLKRAEPELHEEDLLLRALRDFTLPKILPEDRFVFGGILKDVFPSRSPSRRVDAELEEAIKGACGARDLWPDAEFMLKVAQLEEALAIRSCVFVMGETGAGKSECWRTLQRARQLMGQRTVVRDINPKTQDAAGLYGHMSMATKEWRDGLLSKIMRDLGQAQDTDDKWLIIDGDLDANWVESMNSVMDDSRVLTLASNERIPLHSHMRMIFEVRDLAFATPSSTSRAAIVYLSTAEGFQWRSLIAAWVQQKEWDDHVKEVVSELFTKYVDPALAEIGAKYRMIVDIKPTSMVNDLLTMLDCLISSSEERLVVNPKDARSAAKAIEPTFAFCTVWALGAGLSEVDGVDYRKEFSDWWKSTFKTVKFPNRDTIFDYYLDPESDRFDLWKNSSYFYSVEFDPSKMSILKLIVPTPETACVTFWIERMLAMERAIMLVGGAGCGKTAIMQGVLDNLDPDENTSTKINLNYYTNAAALQAVMEASLEKKAGTAFGPINPGSLIYFLDDLNLPEVDPYGTQSAIALVRQHIDYGHIHDRRKLVPNTIQDCQYVACMNHTAGSSKINPRLQRHFLTFAIGFPAPASLTTIFQTILDGHLQRFGDGIRALSTNLISAALGLHADVTAKFRKSVTNFHYEFNIRHLSQVFQGLLAAQPGEFIEPAKFVMLWLHESERVYGDRLASADDLQRYNETAAAQAKRRFPNLSMAKFFAAENADPLLFCHFTPEHSPTDHIYDQAFKLKELRPLFTQSLEQYNEFHSVMGLILFDEAIKHVCRIARIILSPGGHALLVGASGSGKQSLSRLAAFMCSYEPTQITFTPSYGVADFKEDIKAMYIRSGLKGEKLMFLLSGSQICDERLLVCLNDLLSSGKIPDLYAEEEKDAICTSVQSKAKLAGLPTDPESCFDFFIEATRKNLHCVLCFSPLRDNLQSRARRFPALVSCTVIDWFQPWPVEALVEVGRAFTDKLDFDDDDIQAGIENFMPFCFASVNRMAEKYLKAEQRHVYATPKSYLELVGLYTKILESKRNENRKLKERLEKGLHKLAETAQVVNRLENNLHGKLDEAEAKRVQAQAQAEEVERESAVVAREVEAANKERAKRDKVAAGVQTIKDDMQRDLDEAEPLLKKALDALDTLNKKDLGECKSLSTAPKGVDDVFSAVMILLAGVEPNIQLAKTGKPKNLGWEGAKREMMSNVNEFLSKLKDYKNEVDQFRVPKVNWANVRPLLQLSHFNPDAVEKKNRAAGGVASWVINMVHYHDAIVDVEPKRQTLAEAEEKLAKASKKLEDAEAKVGELQSHLEKLQKQLDKANEIKDAIIKEAETGKIQLELAQRLMSALTSENESWAAKATDLDHRYDNLVGDSLLAAAFLSFIGPFSREYRDKLIFDEWLPFLEKAAAGESIPISEDLHPVALLAGPAAVASWQYDGLPQDSMSTDNGALTVFSQRWPFIIDPQMQGAAWIRAMERRKLKNDDTSVEKQFHVLCTDSEELVTTLVGAVAAGESVLIENLSTHIDGAMMSLVYRQFAIRGEKKLVRIGDSEIVVHPDFRLYMHTKQSNPHFPPELQAECTLVNFSVTQDGLEEQLLSLVVRKELPDLAKERVQLIQQQNRFTMRLKNLEDTILTSLADAEGDICQDVDLIESVEHTKQMANETEEKSALVVQTQNLISEMSEKYRSVASRGALLFFIMSRMYKLQSSYVYSLNSFVVMFLRAIDVVTESKPDDGDQNGSSSESSMMARLRASAQKVVITERFLWNKDLLTSGIRNDEQGENGVENLDLLALVKSSVEALGSLTVSDEEIAERCAVLQNSITAVIFNYLRRGLFEKDHLPIATQLCFQIMLQESVLEGSELDALINGRSSSDPGSMGPLAAWLPGHLWARFKGLEEVDGFETLGDDIMCDADDWREWYELENPEDVRFPGDYARLSEFKKLLLVRVLRPDRMTERLSTFVADNLSKSYVESPCFDMKCAYEESSSSTPLLFWLFPGVDPTQSIVTLGKQMDMTEEQGRFVHISMGQGQEKAAVQFLTDYAETGGWVFLQNVHLVPKWLGELERLLENLHGSAHEDFRVYLSAASSAAGGEPTILPESLLESSIKICLEPHIDLKSNLRSAWASFSEERIRAHRKPKEFQQALFALSFFHALVIGRRRFSTMGWSKSYHFSDQDLGFCADIVERCMANGSAVPWADIRCILGESAYGGRITDMWDQRTCESYLSIIMTSKVMDEDTELAPGFAVPEPGCTFKQVASHIEKHLPKESASLYGLHANADIDSLTARQSELFESLSCIGLDLGNPTSDCAHDNIGNTVKDAPRASGHPARSAAGPHAQIRATLKDILSRLPSEFDLVDIKARANQIHESERSPYILVCLQEAVHFNVLLRVMRDSLTGLERGLNGHLSMTQEREELAEALAAMQVPGRNPVHTCSWDKYAWPSSKGLADWFQDLIRRSEQLRNWTAELSLPKSIWLAGLCKPGALLAAISQTASRAGRIPLESCCIETHCTTFTEPEDVDAYPEDGVYVHGLYMEGARWDDEQGLAYEEGSTECGGSIVPAQLNEFLAPMPVMLLRAVSIKPEWQPSSVGYLRNDPSIYEAPVYSTTLRGSTFIFTATLPTNSAEKSKWTLAGVSLVLQTDN